VNKKKTNRLDGQVRIVGVGLLGASIGLSLAARGIDVILADAAPNHLRLAVDYGAGRLARSDDAPTIVVVAVPPDVTADVVAAELAAFPAAVVVDVASVKKAPLDSLRKRGVDTTNYVGSHPLAGRERGGTISASAELFVGRPWVVCRDERTPAWVLARVDDLVLDVGASPIEMTPDEHDRAVGLISHVPQVVSSMLARRLTDAPEAALRLVGSGVRDATRIAASEPELWVQILGANADVVVDILDRFLLDVRELTEALRTLDAPGSRRALAQSLADGRAGVARLPGKHGVDRRLATIVVMIDDTPGQLARLFAEIGDLGVNLEDLRIEHSPGAQIGFVELAVLPEAVASLSDDLTARGWRIAL
jgi:prephenate dehydrogenase